MLGLTGQRPASPDGKRIKPLAAHGLVAMSIGFLIDPEQPMVWRGPMVTQALTQLLSDTDWGELDYLVIDMQLAVALAAILGAATGLPTPEMVTALAFLTLLTTIVSGADYLSLFTRRALAS